MIWQNPWAFAALLALALPVLIHLLSRKRAVLHKFPSLRFLNVTRLLPTRSPHISDVPLLLMRLGVFAAAVLALAQPVWLSAARTRKLSANVARVIIIDTSQSMQRPTPSGRSALDSARLVGEGLAGSAAASITLQTAFPARAIAGAVLWLKHQGSTGEIVILSDFQAGSVDSGAVAAVPQPYGVRLLQVAGSGVAAIGTTEPAFRTNAASVTVTADSARTTAEWKEAATAAAGTGSVLLLASPDDQPTAALVQRAAERTVPATLPDSTLRVAVVYPGAPDIAALRGAARAPTVAWISNVMLKVSENEVLHSAAFEEAVSDTTVDAPFVVLARNGNGVPVVFSAEDSAVGRVRLLLFQRGGVRSLSAAALLAAVNAAVSTPTGISEREPGFATAALLKQLERAPAPISRAASPGSVRAGADLSDGRWFWILALVLLGVETFMRRNMTSAVAPEPA